MNEAVGRLAKLSPSQREFVLRQLRQKAKARPEMVAEPADSDRPALVPDPENRYRPFPLLDIQETYLAGRSGYFDLGTSSANVYIEYEIEGTINSFTDLFEPAFNRLIERHDNLRLTLLADGRQQILERVPPYHARVLDLRRENPEISAAKLDDLRSHLRYTKAPVDEWPLFELHICHLEAERALLLGRFDALLVDGVSREQLTEDLFTFMQGRDPRPLPPISLRDYAMAREELPQSVAYQRARDYWMRRLASLPPAPELPLRGPIEPRTSARLTLHFLDFLDPAAWSKLQRRAARHGVTPTMVTLSAYVDVLRAWSRGPTFTLAVDGTDYIPHDPGLEQVAGNFNTVNLLEIEASQGCFLDRTRSIQKRWAADVEHRSFSGLRVLRELKRSASAHAWAPFPLVFNSVVEHNQSKRRDGSPAAPPAGEQPVQTREVDVTLYMPQVLLLTTLGERGDGALVGKGQAAEEALAPGVASGILEAFRRHLEDLAERQESWQEEHPRRIPQPQFGSIAGSSDPPQTATFWLEAPPPNRSTGLAARPVAPRDEVERQLIRIWQTVLKRDTFGVSDDFFELGGDSFKTVLLLHRIEEAFGHTVRASAFFRKPTVEHLASMVRGGELL